MATTKKFNVVYGVAKESAYAQEAAALVLASSLNTVVEFTPVLAPNGLVDAGATTAEYTIQRVKRVKGKAVANANAGTTAASLAALDSFSKVDWETIGVATGELRSVGVKLGINEEFDADSMGEVHAKAVADSVNIQVIERHEALLDEAITNAQDGGKFTAPAAGTTPIFDKLTEVANSIMLKSDDFKHMTSKANLVIVLHPSVADLAVKEIGTVFNQEAPIYKTGLMSRTSINGIPVIVDANLNKYEGAAATELIGAVVMDIEALAFRAKEFAKPVSVDLGLTKYFGQFFYNIQKAVDPSRIYKIEWTKPTALAKTAKASV